MVSLHHLVAVLVPDEKLLVLIFDTQFFFKTKQTSFTRDQYCHLADATVAPHSTSLGYPEVFN